jgi:predicted Holliday junction resolvase-like endonuclease
MVESIAPTIFMNNETFLVLLVLAVVVLTFAVCCLLVLTAKFYWQKRTALRDATVQFEQWKYQSETSIRNDAIQRSQSVIIGKVTEHLIPYLPHFKFNPKDVRFMGSPIDLIVFEGMCDGDLKDIVFVEVKTGPSARLTPKERQIKDAVDDRRIRWMELRVDRADALMDPVRPQD